jgi:hypothetical protein
MLCRLALALACGLALAAPSLADDTPICPGFPCTGANVPAAKLQQADWKLVSQASTPVAANRIYYAREPSATKRWESRLSSYDRDSNLQQDFSHTGLVAIFLTPRALGFTIDGVFPHEDGSLYVQIRAAPPPPPWPSCEPGAACPALIIPGIVEAPQYVLIAIRKGSLPAPVQRLYITEVPSPVLPLGGLADLPYPGATTTGGHDPGPHSRIAFPAHHQHQRP